ncbi:hypothetical protein BOX15_Mlig013115g1 [Macrostomum lignano]|uniref:GAR domain-containing protein n=1 Tax=Macrostomum lignano TaxID=282301 RepID=A0A267GM89_9PLAT|nr:hypothetical protein BOX15_Mlig013115g1 [Macrostomum lignano]
MHNRTEAVNSQAYCLAQSPASPSASSASYYHRLYANFLFNSMTSMRRNSAIPTGTQSLHRRFSLRERGERQSQSSSPAGGAANQSTTLLRTATLTAAAATASSQLQLGEMNSSSAASARRPSVSSTTSTGDSGLGRGGGGGLQQYRSRHDYLYAMTEDLADWLNFLYDRDITVESFFDELANGALLCIHAGQLQLAAEEYFSSQQAQQQQRQKLLRLPPSAPRYRLEAKAGTFQARDNIANFISWCRSLGLPDCLLFETEDLANRKNTRHVILCLLEVARAGATFGVEVPELVRFEREIDEQELSCSSSSSSSCTSNDSGLASAASPAVSAAKPNASSSARPASKQQSSSSSRRGTEAPAAATALPAFKRKKPTRWQCDLKSLDELVRELINECTCEQTFPMKRLDEGKYLFGDAQMLIFVRVLRNHVMVRVGGGWDSLEHLLMKHDPCRSAGNSSRSGVPINHQEERHRRQQQQKQTEHKTAAPASSTAAPASSTAAPASSTAAPALIPSKAPEADGQKKDEKFVRPSQPAPKKASSAQQQQKRQQPPLQQKSPMSAIDAHRRNSLQPRRAPSPVSSPSASPLTARRQPQQQRPAASSSRLSKK